MNDVQKRARKIKSHKRLTKKIKLILMLLILLVLLLYMIVSIVYNKGNFSITLDDNLHYKRSLIIYDNPEYKVYRSELYATPPDTFDNISYKWLPNDLVNYNGSHNGKNYLAYTFYIENQGKDITDYWTELIIKDVIKNVDEAIRIRIYKDDQYVTYAKAKKDGTPEKGTIAFESGERIALDHVENFKPGDIIKYTIVLWLEGSDLECTDNILGGEFKVELDFKSEIAEAGGDKNEKERPKKSK